MRTFKKIKRIFSPGVPPGDPETLQQQFRDHYSSFRSLLTANNNALDLMAEMEEALTRGQPFGMAFVRGHCTAVSVNVYKMVQNLQELSDGKYRGLFESFAKISGEMEAILARQLHVPEGKFVMPLSEVTKENVDLVGDKMANLGEVRNRVGLRVPSGFVITGAATRHFMSASGLQDEINRLLKTLDLNDIEKLYTVSAQIQRLISESQISGELASEIQGQYRELMRQGGEEVLVSMRSSAVEEDRSRASFAGQYRTQLNIAEDLILQTYKEIVASKYSSQAIVYRHQRGFRHQDVIMCVGCLAMVDAAVSGVMFSRSPRNPQSAWVEINASPGLASQVVDGTVDTDFYSVGREDPQEIIQRDVIGRGPVLSEEQIRELARTGVLLERHFGVPQDIEWSVDRDGAIVILQSRPLAQPDEVETISKQEAVAACGQKALVAGGLTASRGVAYGPAFIVRSKLDLLEFPVGAVLVVEQPSAEWATLLNRAVAVVSERGHAATHLAIVARELGIPAIFGMRKTIGTLQNGGMVTVDATNCCLYAGRNDEALKRAAPPPNLMADSPIYHLLEDILEQVLPLNLTDPGSPYFKSSYCRTLHDITRFCHEKAVMEMFAFGEKAHFDARSGKQLGGNIPFQWWVIDLDDGFREGFDTSQKYVFMEDIVSVPMKAIWEGMTAKPWQGPPPLSVKGFGSVLFRSTMNPSLEPAVGKSLGTRNYFLISKNFCNLSMRLGYHFTLVEAYLGSHLMENYVSFTFRGGAADRSRRFVRVYLLRDILERYGFRVEVIGDALTARIEKKEQEDLLAGLKALGYLLIHTRQLDMVMLDKGMADHYRQQILSDLEILLQPPTGE